MQGSDNAGHRTRTQPLAAVLVLESHAEYPMAVEYEHKGKPKHGTGNVEVVFELSLISRIPVCVRRTGRAEADPG